MIVSFPFLPRDRGQELCKIPSLAWIHNRQVRRSNSGLPTRSGARKGKNMSNTGLENFDRTVQISLEWVDEVGEIMGRDRRESYQAMRSVLHSLRDRLTVEESADLSAQLPMLIRGMYYDGWNPSKQPVKIRDREEFIDYVSEQLGELLNVIPPTEALEAVFRVLQRRITPGEIEDIQRMFPEALRELWPEPAGG